MSMLSIDETGFHGKECAELPDMGCVKKMKRFFRHPGLNLPFDSLRCFHKIS